MKEKKKFYFIYQTTNNLNNKFYIGKHETYNLEDDYFGSGVRLQNAIKKYGIENFTFKILILLQNREELELLEKLVVNEDFLKRPDIYNLCEGGHGGDTWSCTNRKHTQETKQKISISINNQLKESGEAGHIKRSNISKMNWQKLKQDPQRLKEINLRRSVSVSKALKNRHKDLSDKHRKAISQGLIRYYNSIGRKTKYHNPMPYRFQNASGKMVTVYLENEEHRIYECDLQWYIDNGWKRGRNPNMKKPIASSQEMKDNSSGKGKFVVFNKDLNQVKRINPNDLNQYLENGWIRGYRK